MVQLTRFPRKERHSIFARKEKRPRTYIGTPQPFLDDLPPSLGRRQNAIETLPFPESHRLVLLSFSCPTCKGLLASQRPTRAIHSPRTFNIRHQMMIMVRVPSGGRSGIGVVRHTARLTHPIPAGRRASLSWGCYALGDAKRCGSK